MWKGRYPPQTYRWRYRHSWWPVN